MNNSSTVVDQRVDHFVFLNVPHPRQIKNTQTWLKYLRKLKGEDNAFTQFVVLSVCAQWHHSDCHYATAPGHLGGGLA